MSQSEYLHHPHLNEEIKTEDFIAGLAKGLSLLEAFGVDRQRLNVTQVSQRTGISRTAARRYLKTLKYLGYLETDEHYYWLTHRVLRFASSYLNSAQLTKTIQPYLNLLSTQIPYAFSFVVLDEHEVVPIARSHTIAKEQIRVSPYGVHLGNRLPAHATSTGKVLLSTFSVEQQKSWIDRHGLKRLTPCTIIDEVIFLQTLKDILSLDYCLSQDEHELGIIALAVPIYNAKGEVIGALNCIASTQQVDSHYMLSQVLPLLRNTANELRNVV